MAEVKHSVDPRFSHKDLSPYRVTDYKLYPADFRPIQTPTLEFDTSEYVLTAFHIRNGSYPEILSDLQQKVRKNHRTEYGHIVVTDDEKYFQTKKILTGETAIGFEVVGDLHISDYFHTHSRHAGEHEEMVNLFSPDDLYAMSAKSVDRMWLVTPKNVWAMVNLYGNRFYYAAQAASQEMLNKFSEEDSYDKQLAKLISTVQECEFRLYKSTNTIDYTLVS